MRGGIDDCPPYVGIECCCLCVVVDSGVGIASCCWWVVAWTVGQGLRVGAAFCCAGVGATGLAMRVGIVRVGSAFCCCARRECGIGIGCRDCLSFLLVRECRIAGLQDCFIRLQDCFIRFQDCFIRFQDCFASRFQDCFASRFQDCFA